MRKFLSSRSSSSSSLSQFGIVIDIDGVLIRGKFLLPHTKSALQLLYRSNLLTSRVISSIPFLYLTNGGGLTEKQKAEELTQKLGFIINEKQIILSHTPYQLYLPQYQDEYVLIIGGKQCLHVAETYGFKKAITSSMLHEAYPDIYPLHSSLTSHSHPTSPRSSIPPLHMIKAAFIFAESDNWGLDIQLLSDIAGTSTHFPIYACNNDLVYNSNHSIPRYTQGAFLHSLQSLYRTYHKKDLQITYCGKPYLIQYQYAEKILQEMQPGLPLSRYYGIGDNPASDIRGANSAGRKWKSILVKTGIYQEGDNLLKEDVPHYCEDNILTAIERIFDLEGITYAN